MHGRNVGPRKKSGATETGDLALGLHHCWGENVQLARATGRQTPLSPPTPKENPPSRIPLLSNLPLWYAQTPPTAAGAF